MVTALHRKDRWLAIALAFLAGFVDGQAFVELGGFFVSFMSGNSTRLGVGIVGERAAWQMAGMLIAAFFEGVTIGSLISRMQALQPARRIIFVLGLLLACGAASAELGYSIVATLFMAAAMGMENAVFERGGEVRFGLTYMTGAVVKLGQHFAARLLGERAEGTLIYALLWAALVAGSIAGAAVHLRIGLGGLWFAWSYAWILAMIADRDEIPQQ